MNAEEPQEVTGKELREFIRSWCDNAPGARKNKCRIFAKLYPLYMAVDNTTGHCLIKRFGTRREAVIWLAMKKPTDNCNYQSAGGKESLRLSASIITQEINNEIIVRVERTKE